MDGGTTTDGAIGISSSTYVGGNANYEYGFNNAVQADGTVSGVLMGISQNINATFSGSSVAVLRPLVQTSQAMFSATTMG